MHSPLVLLEPSQPLLSHRHRLCSCFWLQILSLVGAWSPSLWAWKGLLSYLLQPVQRGFQGQGPFLQRRNRNLESFFFFFFSLWHTLEEDGGWEGEGSGHWVVLWCDTEYWVVNLLWFVQKKKVTMLGGSPNHRIQRDHRERLHKYSSWQTSWGSSRQPVSNHQYCKCKDILMIPSSGHWVTLAFKSSQQRPQMM